MREIAIDGIFIHLFCHSVINIDIVLSVPRHVLQPCASIEINCRRKPSKVNIVVREIDSLANAPGILNLDLVMNKDGIVDVEAVIANKPIAAVFLDLNIGPGIFDSFVMLSNFVFKATGVVPDCVFEIPLGCTLEFTFKPETSCHS